MAVTGQILLRMAYSSYNAKFSFKYDVSRDIRIIVLVKSVVK
jgi:hypothetical protein